MSRTGISTLGLKIEQGAIVCSEAILKGIISIGSKSIVHPNAILNAEGGPITIGSANIIEELATLHNTSNDGTVMAIGSGNFFKIGATCLSMEIGNNNVFDIKSYVGSDVKVGSGCHFGPKCRVEGEQVIRDGTIILAEDNTRYSSTTTADVTTSQLQLLSTILPNYHKLIKPRVSTTT